MIIDQIPFATSATVTGDLEVEKDEFYPIVIEYVHQTDEANGAHLLQKKQVIPSSALYFTRNIGQSLDLTTEPLSVSVVPGSVDISSTARGDGLFQ